MVTDRRDFLALGGLAGVTALLARPGLRDALAAAAASARSGEAPHFDVLNAEQAADLEAVAAQVIPTDDLPGAREARVIVFIDRSLGTWAQGQREPLLQGLADLNRRVAERWPGTARFASLDGERQLVLLRAVETTPFFALMQLVTKLGMFASPQWGGNSANAGYQALGFEPRFIWQPPFGAYDTGAPGGQ